MIIPRALNMRSIRNPFLSLFKRSLYDKKLEIYKNISSLPPLKLLITGAAGQIGYSLLPQLAMSSPFGIGRRTILKLLDIPGTENVLKGVKMELEDCCSFSSTSIETYTDPEAAYKDSEVIVMLANGPPLKSGMPRGELLKSNFKLYKDAATLVKANCSNDVKILVVGNPTNTHALLLIESLKGHVSESNITSLSMLDHYRTTFFLSKRIGVNPKDIRRVCVWGNHSSTMVPDISFAQYYKKESAEWESVNTLPGIEDWTYSELVPMVRNRYMDVINARGKSSALSAANAIYIHLKTMNKGLRSGDFISMGVYHHSMYDFIPNGLVFSLPVIIDRSCVFPFFLKNVTERNIELIKKSAQELLQERDQLRELMESSS